MAQRVIYYLLLYELASSIDTSRPSLVFLFLGLAGVQTAQNSEIVSQQKMGEQVTLSNDTIMFISLSMGFSLLVNAWLFYRITGQLPVRTLKGE